MADTRLTILVDNNTVDYASTGGTHTRALTCEHGLSLLIEHGERSILLDTGQGPALEVNAPALGADLERTEAIVLSHGHHDHSGGLPYAFERASTARVYCHPSVLHTRYAVQQGQANPIGMPEESRIALRALPAGTIRWVLGPTLLAPDVGLSGPIPRLTDYEDTGGPFYLDPEGWRPDPLEDDQALWIRTDEGLVVCLGCAHSGVVNTLEYISRLNGGERIRAVVGGMHLVNADEQRLAKTAEALSACRIPSLIACHCTGAEAVRTLGEILGDSLSTGASGMVLEF